MSSPSKTDTKPGSVTVQALLPRGSFSLRGKFIVTFFVLGFLPLIFIALNIFSGYEALFAEVRSRLSDAALQVIIAAHRAQLLHDTAIFAAADAALVLLGVFIADRFFTVPARRLLVWLRKAREKKFADIEPVTVASSDEIGQLGREMTESILYFRGVEEREKEISRQKSEFISVAAHQLRTPLTGLRWGLESVSDERSTIDKKKVLEDLSRTVGRTIQLVDDLLDVAKIEEGKFGYELRRVDILPALSELFRSVKPIADKRSISLTFSSSAASIPDVFADPERVQLAVSNLLSNALDYTSAGGQVTLSLSPVRGKVEIAVEDTGIGIEAKELPKLFGKFSRGAQATKMQPNGSGLGLYIVRNIAERHGSEVRVASEPGKGSRFSFELALRESDLAAPDVSMEKFFTSF